MNLRIQIFLVIFASLTLGCWEVPNVAKPKSDVEKKVTLNATLDAEAYSIYSIVIDDVYNTRADSVLIYNQTTTFSLPYKNLEEALANLNKRLPNRIEDGILQDFLNNNKTPKFLEKRFNTRVSYSLVSKQYLNSLFEKRNGWNEFLRQHPGSSIINFSRVGLNPSKDKALVYTNIYRGARSGRSYYIILIKENHKWTINRKIDAGVS
ncbi:MAG: hypothetical protein M3405_17505 [Acidobacteriota bacterium]|jgi:hypothetical protein|nr:hypothetical protein [Acidobacteriota bacterium]